MTGSARVTISKGTRIAFDGELWKVAELAVTGCCSAASWARLGECAPGTCSARRALRVLDAPGGDLVSVPDPVEGTLTGREENELGILAGHMREILTGYRHGDEALALPGEPGPEYAPGVPKLERYQARGLSLESIAAESGIPSADLAAGAKAAGIPMRVGRHRHDHCCGP